MKLYLRDTLKPHEMPLFLEYVREKMKFVVSKCSSILHRVNSLLMKIYLCSRVEKYLDIFFEDFFSLHVCVINKHEKNISHIAR